MRHTSRAMYSLKAVDCNGMTKVHVLGNNMSPKNLELLFLLALCKHSHVHNSLLLFSHCSLPSWNKMSKFSGHKSVSLDHSHVQLGLTPITSNQPVEATTLQQLHLTTLGTCNIPKEQDMYTVNRKKEHSFYKC